MRDPRIDPEIGDEICRPFKTALSGLILRRVTRAHGGFVFFVSDNGYYTDSVKCSIKVWRRWAIKAEVIEEECATRSPRDAK